LGDAFKLETRRKSGRTSRVGKLRFVTVAAPNPALHADPAI
jgi:hypothetical protein